MHFYYYKLLLFLYTNDENIYRSKFYKLYEYSCDDKHLYKLLIYASLIYSKLNFQNYIQTFFF